MMSIRSVVLAVAALFICSPPFLRVSAKRNIPGVTSIVALNISNKWLWPEDDSPVFYRHFYQKVTWQEAQSVCEYNRAKLVTVDTSVQYDQVRAYLKELDVDNLVWIGLKKEASHFSWRDASPLEGEGYWLESPPKEPEALCAALDPLNDYRWKTFDCAGPDTATFICEIPIPPWADHGYTGCMLDSLPSLTITYHPEDETVHLQHDCGLDGSRTVACKGTADKRDLMMLLHCNQNISTWYKGMWDSAISVTPRHRRSTSLPGEFTTPTHFVFANDLFDYDEDLAKTTAGISKAEDDNLISNMKSDSSSGQDFMVGFAPEDLSFADEPIKSLPAGSFPVIPGNFVKPNAEGNVVYNSSTTETLSKLTVGTETQLVRSINNSSKNLKSETSTMPLEISTSTKPTASSTISTSTPVPNNSTKGLKDMLISGLDDTEKILEKTAKETSALIQTSAKKLGKVYETTKTKVSESLKSLKDNSLKPIKAKDMEVHTDPASSERLSAKQLVGESLILQKEEKVDSKIKNKVSKIDKNIDFLETDSNKFSNNEHAQRYVNAGGQKLLEETEKSLSGEKSSEKKKEVKLDPITTEIPVSTSTKMLKTTQTETANGSEITQFVSSTPVPFRKAVLRALEEVKEKSAQSLDEIDTSLKTLYSKVIPTVKVGEENAPTKADATTKSTLSTTERTANVKKTLRSPWVLREDDTSWPKRPAETPGLVILDSKGHSLNSNAFESPSADETVDVLAFGQTTDNHLEFKPFFDNEISISKKSAAAMLPVNATSNQTLTGTRSSVSSTAKYERRNLPPVLMIDKVEALNEAVAGAVTTVKASTSTVKSDVLTPTTVRTETMSAKKNIPAILGNKQPLVPTTTRPTTSSTVSTGLPPTTIKKMIEPVPDMPEKPKRSPLFSSQQHRSRYPYFLGRILG